MARKFPVFLQGPPSPWLFRLLSAWVLFILLIYFDRLYPGGRGLFPHFPLSPSLTGEVGLTARLSVWWVTFTALATGFLIMGILWSCGKRLSEWLCLSAPQPVRFCLDIGLGLFLFNGFWMGLGLTKLWFEPLWLLMFVLLVLLFLVDLLRSRRKGFTVGIPPVLDLGLILISLAYVAFLMFQSILPETFYDSLNYFLGMPSYWLWHHGLCDYPTHILSGYFHGGSLFFLNGFVLAGTEGAKVLAALVLLGVVLVCYGWGKALAGPRAGRVAAAAVLTFPLLYLNAWAVRVDGLLAFVLVLFFYAIEKGASLKKGGGGWIAAAGIFMGLALTIKPTAVVALGAALLALLWRDGPAVLRKKGWATFAGILALEVGPWLLKNACFTGNPFFPYAISIMGGRQFPAWSYGRLLHENRQFLPMNHGIFSILSLPWRLTIPGAGDDQFIGPILLAFLPLFLLLRFRDPALKFLSRAALLSLVMGLTLSHMLRFSIPAFVMLLLVLSAALAALPEGKWFGLWKGTVAASAILCVGQFALVGAEHFDGWGVWTGRESRSGFLSRKLGASYGMARWVNQNLPQDARLLAVGDAQVLYYQRPVYANSVFDEPFFAAAAREEKDADGILRRLKELGVTHVVFSEMMGAVNSKEYRQYELSKEQWLKLDDFTQRGLEPMVDEKNICLYRVRERLAPPGPLTRNPFRLFPPQGLAFLRDLGEKDYSQAGGELNQLLDFFPGDPYWMGMEKILGKREKAK